MQENIFVMLLTHSILHVSCFCEQLDFTSTTQGLRESTFRSVERESTFRFVESTTTSDVETTPPFTFLTDLTTETMQQNSFSTNQGAAETHTTLLPQTTEGVSESTSDGNKDQTSYLDSTTLDQSESSEATSTIQNLLTNTINITNIDWDSVTSSTAKSVGASDMVETVSSRNFFDVVTTSTMLPNTVDLNNESLVLNITQDYTEVNDTQHDESKNDTSDDGDSSIIFCFVVVCSISKLFLKMLYFTCMFFSSVSILYFITV